MVNSEGKTIEVPVTTIAPKDDEEGLSSRQRILAVCGLVGILMLMIGFCLMTVSNNKKRGVKRKGAKDDNVNKEESSKAPLKDSTQAAPLAAAEEESDPDF